MPSAEGEHQEWLLAATKNVDAWLRHPTSLEMMRRHVEALVDRQARFNNAEKLTTPAPHGHQPYAGITSYEVDREVDGTKLCHFTTGSNQRFREPLLICYSLINRPYILDLHAQRSVVRQLLRAGFDVYLLDWGVPDDADRETDLSDYVGNRLRTAVEHICQRNGSEQVHLLGYCLGGTLSAMFAARYPERVSGLILMAAPIDCYAGQGLLQLWADPTYFDVDRLIDVFGNCPGELLQFCFQMLKPVQNFYEKYATLAEKLNDEDYLSDFQAMERWTSDSVPIAGAAFRQIVKELYRENLLARNSFSLAGHRIDLQTIDHPLLLLTADKDHLVPPSSTLALAKVVASRDISYLSVDCGHVGLAVGRRAHRDLWPSACEWLAAHSSPIGESAAVAPSPSTDTTKLPHARNVLMNEHENLLNALRRSSFFQNVVDKHLESLANISRIVEYPARTNIFKEFEEAKDVYIVLSGEVSLVSCEPEVGCRQLSSARTGELLGWSSLLERGRMSATAYTLIPTKVIVIDGHQLHELCQQQPDLGYEIMSRTAQALSERLDATRVQLLEMSGVHLPEVALESD